MPWPTYTESFIRTSHAGEWVTYTVPEDMRAVVKCLTVTNLGARAVLVSVRVHGYRIGYFQLPVSWATEVRLFTVVAYERETMQVYMDTSDANATLSGYLFADKGPGNPPPVEYIPTKLSELGDVARPLPSEGDLEV